MTMLGYPNWLCSHCYVDSSGKTRTDSRSGTVAPGESTESALTEARREALESTIRGASARQQCRHCGLLHSTRDTGTGGGHWGVCFRLSGDGPLWQGPRRRDLNCCRVRFMGETAKILTPDKRVLMPTLGATCSLDEGCPIDEFSAFCDAHRARGGGMATHLQRLRRAPTGW